MKPPSQVLAISTLCLIRLCPGSALGTPERTDADIQQIATTQYLPKTEQLPSYQGLVWRALRFDLPADMRNTEAGVVASGMYYWAVKESGQAEPALSDAARFRSYSASAALCATVTIVYHPDPNAFLDGIRQYSPPFQNAVSMSIGEWSLKTPDSQVFNGYFRRGRYVVNVYLAPGSGGTAGADPAQCGLAIAKIIDNLITPGAASTTAAEQPQVDTNRQTADTGGGVSPETEREAAGPGSGGWTLPAGAGWELKENPSIAIAVICARLEDNQPVGVARTFGKGTGEVTLAIKSKDRDVSLRIDWFRDGRRVLRDALEAPSDAVVHVTIMPAESDYLTPGKYRAEIMVDSQIVGGLDFEILAQ